MDQLKMRSPNLVDSNIEKISALFPNCITESKDENGELKKAIDFDLLKQELSQVIVEGEQERYRLDWVGKKEAILTANAPIAKTLRPCRDESVDFDKTENLFIEGDNLEALKLLQENYLGKVKMIYIDPPYNTGNDFIYEDDFAESTDEFFERSNQVDDEGNRLVANFDSKGRFHSDWLSMMYSRLKLARNLLKDSGVIFISIDENEVENLKKICDEIFGEKNFIANMIWQSRTSISNDQEISNNHTHNLIYAKDKERVVFWGDPLNEDEYKNPDNDHRGPWKLVPLDANKPGGDTYYPILNPFNNEEYYPPNGRSWAISSSTFNALLADGRIKFGLNDQSAPKRKLFLQERLAKGDVKTPSSLILDVGTTKSGTEQLMAEFGGVKVFDYPKPLELLKKFIAYGAGYSGSELIMDFFVGSGTTPVAINQFNQKFNTSHKFIAVQFPENLKELVEQVKDSALKTVQNAINYLSEQNKPLLISEITKERLALAHAFINDEKIDTGFRVLKIDSTNVKDVYYTPDALKQADMLDLADHIKSDRTSGDLLFQVMLDWGLELSLPIECKTVAGKEVFYVAGNSLVACFDELNFDVVDEVAKDYPLRFVSAEKAIHLDHDKTNIKERFKQLSPDTEVKFL